MTVPLRPSPATNCARGLIPRPEFTMMMSRRSSKPYCAILTLRAARGVSGSGSGRSVTTNARNGSRRRVNDFSSKVIGGRSGPSSMTSSPPSAPALPLGVVRRLALAPSPFFFLAPPGIPRAVEGFSSSSPQPSTDRGSSRARPSHWGQGVRIERAITCSSWCVNACYPPFGLRLRLFARLRSGSDRWRPRTPAADRDDRPDRRRSAWPTSRDSRR